MSTNHTEHYTLSQWERTDQVLMDDFNADNAKIDAALKAVDRRVDAKADISALETEINARSSSVSSLNSSVSSLNYSLSRRGNCDIRASSYTGNGNNTNTISFPSVPSLVVIIGPQSLAFISGQAGVSSTYNSSGNFLTPSWSGSQLTISCTVSEAECVMNRSKGSYKVIAFYSLS